ncbi:Crp/Fnr family transcriptional regulator [Streptomyces sp. NPDC004732]|uniref:Crp/Fnr family transcriptional regulator n=1 Tax=Streptomyces sp. NPDC004732 TaxID=3154290 RepID=UPI0033B7FAD6
MSEQKRVSPVRALRDLVPGEAWEALTRFPHRKHCAGDILLRQGDPGTHVLALIQGMVKVVITEAEGKERVLAFRGPGEALGEMAVQDGGGRLADVRAISDCEVAIVPAAAFRDFVKQHDLADQLTAYAVSRVREQVETREGDIDHRLAVTLVRLVEISGTHTFALTREELAQRLGVSRYSVTKALARLGPAVRAGRTCIDVLDTDSLRTESTTRASA